MRTFGSDRLHYLYFWGSILARWEWWILRSG
jgi:hypothetical protein